MPSLRICLSFCAFIIAASAVTAQKTKPKGQGNPQTCPKSEFTCNDGRCVGRVRLCDGVKNCKDGSDETQEVCGDITCPDYMIRCNYGACLAISKLCNGVRDCADASDEPPAAICKYPQIRNPDHQKPDHSTTARPNRSTTQTTKRTTTTKRPAVTKPTTTTDSPEDGEAACPLPTQSNDKTYTISDCKDDAVADPICSQNAGSFVPPYTDLTYRCNSGYFGDYFEFKSYCTNGEWTPVPSECRRCGIPFVETASLHREKNLYTDFPWHVVIYESTKFEHVCGGTIISPYLIITAAHCFYDDDSHVLKNGSNFRIMVSKATSDYITVDNDYTLQYEIRNISVPPIGFYGEHTSFASDMAIVEVMDAISINENVAPACIEWHRSDFSPADNQIGQVMSWKPQPASSSGAGNNKIMVLKNIALPFMSYAVCVETVPLSFKQYVTLDKFCARKSQNGETIGTGDGGTGYAMKKSSDSDSYFLRGVGSTKDKTGTSITTYTNVLYYIDWIKNVFKDVHARRKKELEERKQ